MAVQLSKLHSRKKSLQISLNKLRLSLALINPDAGSVVALKSVLPVLHALPGVFSSKKLFLSGALRGEIEFLWDSAEKNFDKRNCGLILKAVMLDVNEITSFEAELFLPAILIALYSEEISSVTGGCPEVVVSICEEIAALSGRGGNFKVLENSPVEEKIIEIYGEEYRSLSLESKLGAHHCISKGAKKNKRGRFAYLNGLKSEGTPSWVRLGFKSTRSRRKLRITIVTHLFVTLFMAAIQMLAAAWVMKIFQMPPWSVIFLVGLVLERSFAWSDILSSNLFSGATPAFYDYTHSGLPQKLIVAIPIIFDPKADIRGILASVGINAIIANDSNVKFVILSDLIDRSSEPVRNEDEEFCGKLRQAISELNGELGPAFRNCIAYAHRAREYCQSEKIWMGTNRKLGKLDSLNRMINTGISDFYESSIGFESECRSAKYVMILDQDSTLSRNCIHSLAGALDHPANKPTVRNGRVVGGHGMAVAQIFVKAQSLSRWKLPQAITNGVVDAKGGAATVSPSYSLFGRAGYFGKGMYDPRIYTQVAPSIGAASALSHDTVEADVLRPCFVGWFSVMDAFPSGPFALLTRDERWARGDFQNLMLRCLPSRKKTVRLSLLGRLVVVRQCINWACLASLFPYLLTGVNVANGFFNALLLTALYFYAEIIRFVRLTAVKLLSGDMVLSAILHSLNVLAFSIAFRLMASPYRFGHVVVSFYRALGNAITQKNLLLWASMEETKKVDARQLGLTIEICYCGALLALAFNSGHYFAAAVIVGPLLMSLRLTKLSLKPEGKV